jgi:hypothetical protein
MPSLAALLMSQGKHPARNKEKWLGFDLIPAQPLETFNAHEIGLSFDPNGIKLLLLYNWNVFC